MERRNFIALVGTSLISAPVWSNMYHSRMPDQKVIDSAMPDLPYSFDALEPAIDAKTMEIHFTKHYKAYYTNFMAAIKDTPAADMDIISLFAEISKHPVGVRNNGGGYYNHKLFWENLTPAKTEPSAALKAAIDKSLGSMDKFKEEFSSVAKKHFGSGWAWLVVGNDGQLFVSESLNQDNPLMDITEKRGTPLLCLDVWEHAYYLKYQNRRPEYVDNFWNIVNWDTVNRRYENR